MSKLSAADRFEFEYAIVWKFLHANITNCPCVIQSYFAKNGVGMLWNKYFCSFILVYLSRRFRSSEDCIEESVATDIQRIHRTWWLQSSDANNSFRDQAIESIFSLISAGTSFLDVPP